MSVRRNARINNELAAEDAVWEPIGGGHRDPDLRAAVEQFLACRMTQKTMYAVAELLQEFGDYLHERYSEMAVEAARARDARA